YPWDVAKLMAAQGLLGITIAEADGGQGGALIDAVIAIEAVASVCPRSADVVQAGNFGPIRVLAEYGTPEQKRKYLKRLLAGESVISVGMTEPEAGSAVTDLQTTATPEGEGYRVNGSKVFTTHAPHAEVILAYVRYGPGVGGIGSVLVDTKAKGVRACATVGDTAQAVRAPLVRIPGAAVEVRRDENEARRRPAPALPRRGERRPRFPLGGGGRDRQGVLQPGRVRRRERVAAGDGRPRLHAGVAGRVLPAALPRLDDRRRLGRDPQEPHRGSRVRAQLHAAPGLDLSPRAPPRSSPPRPSAPPLRAAAGRSPPACYRRPRRPARGAACACRTSGPLSSPRRRARARSRAA